MVNQSCYRELFLQYRHLIRLIGIVELIEEVLGTLVENRALDSDVQHKDARSLAGVILHAGLQDIASQYLPEKPEDITQSIYLQQVLKQSRTTKTSKITDSGKYPVT